MRQRGKARCLVLLVLQYGMAVLLQNHQERNRAKVLRARPVEGAAPRPAAPSATFRTGVFGCLISCVHQEPPRAASS